MDTIEYNEIEGLDKLRSIDPSKKEKATSSLFQRFHGTVFIDTLLAAKELAKKPKYRALASGLKTEITSAAQGRKLFREVAMYYNIHQGIDRVIFHYKDGDELIFYFFAGSKLIELEIYKDNEISSEAGQVLGVRFAEAGKKSPAAYASMISAGAADVMSKVVKSLLFHKSTTGARWSYGFVGEKGSKDVSKENSRRSRLYLMLIKTFSRQLKMFVYVLRETLNNFSDVHYILSFKKMREFEKLRGVSLKSLAADSASSEKKD